jgi:hypothetical protein
VLFLLTVLLLDWHDARPYHLVVGLLAFPGMVIAVGWAFRGTRWWLYACTAISSAIVLAYVVWWSIEVFKRYSADSMPGLLRTISVQFLIPRALFQQRIAHGDFLHAMYECYWQIGMPIVQILFVLLLANLIKRPAGNRNLT